LQILLQLIFEYIEWFAVIGGGAFFFVFIRYMRGSGRKRVIMMACQWGDASEVRQLIREYPWLAEAPDANGITPLHVASMWGHESIVRMLIDRGAKVNAQNRAGMTPLHSASMAGHCGVVNMLLNEGADPNLCDGMGNAALYFSVWDGHLDIVTRLLSAGANPNATNSKNETPLKRASTHSHPEIIKLLIEAGAEELPG
jgi:ankyrin repeat protein